MEEDTESEQVDNTIEGVDVIHDCLCMACGLGNGITRIMIHKIPYFRELVISSFECNDCNETNNEISFGGEIQLQGIAYELLVSSQQDLDRQIIKSDSAIIKIPELDFEIPANTQKGTISTIEGFLRTAANNLNLYQSERILQQPEVGMKVAEIIMTLYQYAMCNEDVLPFHILVEDPAGNSYIQNPKAPLKDPNMKITYFNRTPEQDISLGLNPNQGTYRDDKESNFKELMTGSFGQVKEEIIASSSSIEEETRLGRSEVISIPSTCPNCQAIGESLTAVTDIPHFKEVIIMAFNCNSCGFKDNEVKGGGSIPTMGSIVSLSVSCFDDLKRDVLKSDSAMVLIPELELELQHGTLGGVYTTVEGLLKKIHTSLQSNNPFAIGDSTTLQHSEQQEVNELKKNFNIFLNKLESLSNGLVFPFTLTLRDPLGNSFISAPLGSFLPPELDTNLHVEDFERSYEENEEFGLNDMNTRDYEDGLEDADSYYNAKILPDRLTHVLPKSIDHPTVFAKGMEDQTPGGIVYSQASISINNMKSEVSIEEEQKSYYQSPVGWSFAKVNEMIPSIDILTEENQKHHLVYLKRQFNVDRDSILKFLPYEEFSGFKEGFVYRLGSQGLGYYEDVIVEHYDPIL